MVWLKLIEDCKTRKEKGKKKDYWLSREAAGKRSRGLRITWSEIKALKKYTIKRRTWQRLTSQEWHIPRRSLPLRYSLLPLFTMLHRMHWRAPPKSNGPQNDRTHPVLEVISLTPPLLFWWIGTDIYCVSVLLDSRRLLIVKLLTTRFSMRWRQRWCWNYYTTSVVPF
jgi:hypothetical protein